MTKVIVMSGVSGSGKSTYAQKLAAEYGAQGKTSCIASADHFFMKEGSYKWDASQLSNAHAECFSKFLRALASGTDLVIADNTGLSQSDLSPYVLAAAAYGIEAEIVAIEADAEVCAVRNQHGLDERAIRRQLAKQGRLQFPKHWKVVKCRGTEA